MVRQRRDARAAQPGRGFFDFLARAAVDDAGLAVVLVLQQAQQLALGFVLFDDGVADVRPVEALDEGARVAQRESGDDVLARDRIGGGGQRHARHTGIALGKDRQAQVLLAKIMAPLADAMRFVDGHQRQQATLVQRVEHGQETRRQDALRRRIQQHQPARQQLALDVARLTAVQRAVEKRGVHADLFERTDLVLHQRDQRADDQRHTAAGAVARDRRHLVGQALAAAGGHQHQGVAAVDDVIDDVDLQAAETVVAEDFAQNRQQRGRRTRVGHGADCRRAGVGYPPVLMACKRGR